MNIIIYLETFTFAIVSECAYTALIMFGKTAWYEIMKLHSTSNFQHLVRNLSNETALERFCSRSNETLRLRGRLHGMTTNVFPFRQNKTWGNIIW